MQTGLLLISLITICVACATLAGTGLMTLWVFRERNLFFPSSAPGFEPRVPQVPRVARWLRIPRVLLHEGSQVELLKLQSALDYWRGLGHLIGPVEVTRDRSSVRGAILFVGQWRRSGTSMVTRISGRRVDDGVVPSAVALSDHYCTHEEIISTYADGQIDHAVVVVPPATAQDASGKWASRNMDLVLIHLVGHALGYAHAGSVLSGSGEAPERVGNHVMSALLSEAGWDAYGLQAIERRPEP